MKLTYSICQDLIKRGRGNSKKIANNTYLHKTQNMNMDYFYVQLHGNTILKIYQTHVEHFNCDWQTKTTKDRLNEFGHLNIFQRKFVWYTSDKIPFIDGVAVYYA